MFIRYAAIFWLHIFGFSKGEIRWPAGTYALPRSIYGCPDALSTEWQNGYMNITFNSTIDLFETSLGRIKWNDTHLNNLELLGPYGPHSIQLNFCTRVYESDDSAADVVWPDGEYAVYGTHHGCPSGLTTTFVNRTLPQILFVNKDGHLPDITVIGNLSSSISIIRFRICKKLSGYGESGLQWNFGFPIILLDLDEGQKNSNTFVRRHLYIETTNGRGNTTTYDWLKYMTVKMQEDEVKGETPDYLEIFMEDATILYASNSTYSSGATFRGLQEFIWAEDVWVLYDIGISAVISGIGISGEYAGVGVHDRHKLVPNVFVSEMQWSFLSNGSPRCFADVHSNIYSNFGEFYVDWILIKCANKPVGKYITLLWTRLNHSVNTEPIYMYFFQSTRLFQIITTEVSPRCGRSLGMREGAIQDFQLSASSSSGSPANHARPSGDKEWCADYADPKPFLQIDFIGTMRVEGVQLFYVESTYGTLYGGMQRNSFSFSVQFGTNLTSLHWLPQEFSLDPFIPAASAQTVMFASSLKLRYLRIYPLTYPKCLKLEVIGCQIPGIHRRVCNGPREWYSPRNMYVPHEQRAPISEPFTTTPEDCFNNCKHVSECYLFTYNHKSHKCAMYANSYMYSYRSLALETTATEAFIGICDTDDRLEAYSGYLSSIRDVPLEGRTDTHPAVLVSSGYPIYYPIGATSIWTISFAEGEYVSLLFSHISLNDYKGPEGGGPDSQSVCEDTIYFYPYALTSAGAMYPITYYIETGFLENHPRDELQPVVLTRSSNNQQFSYKMDRNIINIVFKTCPETSNIKTRGNGFRLLTYASDIPTCLRWGFYSYAMVCNWKEAEVSSTSFLGIFFDQSEYNRWILIGNNAEYISLQITDFDVGCETGAVFEITNGDTTQRYCNKNRPIYPIVSAWKTIEIKFHAKPCGSRVLVEGFKGRYKTEIKNQHITGLESSFETDFDTFRQKSVQACSEDLNKCFIMLDLEALKMYTRVNISWNYFKTQICEKYNWTMANVHSKQENDFIRFYLQQHLQYGTSRHLQRPNGYYGYVYLGLRRRNDTFVWSDGSPVTYSAWDIGQPLKNAKKPCTRLNIRSLSNDSTWESTVCFDMQAEYGVCEYPFLSTNASSDSDFAGLPDTTTTTLPVIEQSLYFLCGDGEMISILGHCDGKRDCISGKDEENCRNSNCNSNTTHIIRECKYICGQREHVGMIVSIIEDVQGHNCLYVNKQKERVILEQLTKFIEHTADPTPAGSCTKEQYRCSDGECVDISVLCDYHVDCQGGEDENCDFAECNKTDFLCNSKLCINGSLRCDGKTDCLSGEDERFCSTCNPSTAFNCGDYTCIPLEYRCDGVPDCQSGEDEINCVSPETCQEWWNTGYRENGIYKIHGENIECDFSETMATGKIITKYHSIDFLTNEMKREYGTINLHYGSLDVLEILMNEYTCYQSVDQLCQPWIQELYEVDTDGAGGQNSQCQCLRWLHSFADKDGTFEGCNGDNVTVPNSALHFRWFHKPYIESLQFTSEYLMNNQELKTDIRIRFNPVVCYSDFNSPPPDIVCGNGMTTPNETRCLYTTSVFETVLGCRSLSHLQDCGTFNCPAGYFKCPESFCIENRFVCDGKKHCQAGEDERNCGTPTQVCVSQYRCLQSNICLPLQYLCDGYRHCPLGDDERLCNFRCPQGCSCRGMAADCREATTDTGNTTISNNTKLIDTSTNPIFFSLLTNYTEGLLYLAFLNMSACGVSEISVEFFRSMKNLLILDMSKNNLHAFRSEMFINQHRLTTLLLAGNTDIHFIEAMAFNGLSSLNHFELTDAQIRHISKDSFQYLSLETLDLSNNKIDFVDNQIFKQLTVDKLYLNATSIKKFDEAMFLGVKITSKLITNAYKFCCIKPQGLEEDNCYPHKNEFSSCSDLMRNDALRALLWIIGLFSLLGNAASLIYRFIYDRERLKLGYGIFVTNLAIADFLMGVYLIIIACADVAFRGNYIFHDESWRSSALCKLAGILSTMSSEASVLFICLITLDRILVIKYPFGQVRFTTVSSIISSCIVWVVVGLIAILPVLITSYFKDTFYSKSGVCLALPLTRDRSPGWVYSISIFIGFNFVTFLAIAFGQWMIYRTISQARSKMRSFTSARTNDLRVARNLLLVASTDFLCWFPIGILGIMALANHVIPGEVYAWTAVLVLPINSALNPFLYTLSAIIGRGNFTPDKSEQSRTQVTSIDVLGRHYDVWGSKLFVQPSFTDGLVPLSDYFVKKRFTVNQCLLAAVTVAKGLIFLHNRDVSHSNLNIQQVYVKPIKRGTFSVVLAFHPKLIDKDEEKQQEIKRFGTLLDILVKRCNPTSSNIGGN